MKSMVSKYMFTTVRPKQGDKLEFLKFDPYGKINFNFYVMHVAVYQNMFIIIA